MNSPIRMKFLGAALVTAVLSTSAMAQVSSTPPSPSDRSAPTSNGAMTNSQDGTKSSGTTMRKHKAEKSHSQKANPTPDAQNLKDSPLGTSPGGNGGAAGAGSGSQ